jgi:hypothetical protein
MMMMIHRRLADILAIVLKQIHLGDCVESCQID